MDQGSPISQTMKRQKLKHLKHKKLELLKLQASMKEDLPHLYGKKLYKWQAEFLESKNRANIICAANQIGKSSVAIMRVIKNCTEPKNWDKIWQTRPKMFWYFYPDMDTLRREWNTKWQEYMPRGQFKAHPQYGWKAVMERDAPKVIHWNTGISLYFLTYTKDISAVQAGTVHEITVDEELPVEFYDELVLRLTVTNGIFNMVCTPTLNQPFWKDVIEGDKLPKAFKRQVSMYDCLTYQDGSPSTVFTIDKIKAVEEKCRSEAERLRRVHGRFITEEGREYFAYDPAKNRRKPGSVSTVGWHIYSGVDWGSGGEAHPSAIVWVKVRPDYKKAIVYRAWRGDGIKTTCGDLFNKYMELSKGETPVSQKFDYSAKDFGTIAQRNGVSFEKANKSNELGREVVNTLFKFGMLDIMEYPHDSEATVELDKLSGELLTVMTSTNKAQKKNDLCDALKYAVVDIPWDFESIRVANEDPNERVETKPRVLTEAELQAEQISLRRGEGSLFFKEEVPDNWSSIEDDIEYWNDEYG